MERGEEGREVGVDRRGEAGEGGSVRGGGGTGGVEGALLCVEILVDLIRSVLYAV